MTTRERFAALIEEHGNIAELARRYGVSRRSLEYKRDGERPVREWDVLAMERALEIKRQEAAGAPNRDS